MDFVAEIKKIPGIRVLTDEPMSRHTTFRVGGPADFFLYISGASAMESARSLAEAWELPFYVIGNGSNLLVSDKGIRGAVAVFERPEYPVEITEKTAKGERIRLQAGTLLSAAAREIARRGLKGFEFAAGIPGTVGGAVIMNAGAYGGEIADCIETVTSLTKTGTVTREKPGLDLSYRHSLFMENGEIVTDATFFFEYGEREAILAYIEELNAKRRSKQPLELPSAGSTFKRPEGHFAGKLIQDAGLAGYSIGGAAISEKHCGFIVNKEGATASDIFRLMRHVTERVREVSGVTLEPEVRMLGDMEI